MTTRGGWLYGVFHDREPERCRYGGITTTSAKQRSYGHWHNAINPGQRPQYGPMPSWLRKHQEERDQIKFVELAYFDTLDELKRAEILFIAAMRDRGQCDLNLTDGGEGGNGWRHTPASRARLSEIFSGEGNPMYGVNRKDLMDYARSFCGPRTEEQKEHLSIKMREWWGSRPERRQDQAVRMARLWEEGKVSPMTSEQAKVTARNRKGSLPPGTPEEIVRLRVQENYTYKRIAEELGVPRHQVVSVLGARSAYVDERPRGLERDWRDVRLERAGLTAEDVRAMRRAYAGGESNASINERYPELKRQAIQHITSGRGYKHVV